MRKKHDNDLIWILGLLALAFLGKGPLAARGTEPTMPTEPTRPGMGMESPGRSTGTGENSNPTDMGGVTSRSSPGHETQNMPGAGSGVPDKSKNNSAPMSPIDMPDMQMPPRIVNLINPVAPMGGTMISPGVVFVPGLDLFGNAMGGPGAGPYDPSITTKYGNTTYTNANLTQLAKDIDAKNQELYNYYSGKETSHPMMIAMVTSAPTMKNGSDMPMMPAAMMAPAMAPMMAPMMPATKTTPMQNINTMDPNTLSRLFQGAYGFGQNVLNQFLQGGQNLFNFIGKNTPGIAIPGVPGAAPLLPEIAV